MVKLMDIVFESEQYYRLKQLHVTGLLERSSYCIFDLEGTGPNPHKDHMIQIGAVKVSVEGEPLETFQSLVRSPVTIPPFIEQMTGITNQAMAGAPGFVEAYAAFGEFAQDSVLVTQAGYEYDWPIVKRHCDEYGVREHKLELLDLKPLFQFLHPEVEAVISTNLLLSHYSIACDDLRRHDALDDCKLIGRIFAKLLAEYRARSLNEVHIQELRVRRFQL